MNEDLRTASNWAKELHVPEKKLKDAIKVNAVKADAKKGACSYYSRATVEKAVRASAKEI